MRRYPHLHPHATITQCPQARPVYTQAREKHRRKTRQWRHQGYVLLATQVRDYSGRSVAEDHRDSRSSDNPSLAPIRNRHDPADQARESDSRRRQTSLRSSHPTCGYGHAPRVPTLQWARHDLPIRQSANEGVEKRSDVRWAIKMPLTFLPSQFPSMGQKKAGNHKTVLPTALHCTQA